MEFSFNPILLTVEMVVRKIISLAVAALLAAQLAALMFAILGGSWKAVPSVFAFALMNVLLLGIPLSIGLQWKGWFNVLSSALTGFVIGSLYPGIYGWPLKNHGPGYYSSVDGVPIVIDGIPTLAGWLVYLEQLAGLGVPGAIAGVGFWLVIRASPPLQAIHDHDNTSGINSSAISKFSFKLRIVFGAVIIALSAGLFYLVPASKTLKSCHDSFFDIFRDGPHYISSVLHIDLEIPHDQWPILVTVLRQYAEDRGLSFRSRSETRPDRAPFGHAILCAKGRVTITARQTDILDINNTARVVSFYKAQREVDWEELAYPLIAILSQQWPEKVTVQDAGIRAGKYPRIPPGSFLNYLPSRP